MEIAPSKGLILWQKTEFKIYIIPPYLLTKSKYGVKLHVFIQATHSKRGDYRNMDISRSNMEECS
jgi:hypothetical protein